MTAKKRTPSPKPTPVRARLFLSDEGRAVAARSFPAAAAALEKHFAGDLAPNGADVAFASDVAQHLRAVTHSSDTECGYFACAITGVDLENDRAFLSALGIGRNEKVKVGGRDCEKLETTYGPLRRPAHYEENTPTLGLLTLLVESELEEVDEYLTKAAQETYAAAIAVLESREVVVGGVLCADDGATKIVFTLARGAASEAWSGVMTFRIET